MLRIAIIGSAGRGDDSRRMGRESFPAMVAASHKAAVKLAGGAPWRAVSGGAAWADHVAVVLFLNGAAAGLDLELPAELTASGFVDTGDRDFRLNPGGTSNHYHRLFGQVAGRNPFADLQAAISRPGCSVTVARGFFARNSAVAQADHCIALTYGRRAQLKPGGTARTMTEFLARGQGRSVHIDLNSFEAFSPARVN